MSDTLSIFSRNKLVWTDIIAILFAAIVLGSPTLVYPFGRDQGEYAWIATSILNGNLSYSDVFNVKPPFTHLVHQVALLTFGYNMASIRIFDLLWQIATAVLIYKIAIKIEQPRGAGILAAVLYLLLYYRMNFWNTAQTDGFLTLPITAGILLFLQAQQTNHFWLYAANGIAIGLGILFKYPIGILIIFLALLVLLKLKRNGLLFILWMGIGLSIPLIIGATIMFLRGNLADFLWIQFTYVQKYSAISHQDQSYMDAFILAFLAILKTPVPGWASILGVYSLSSEHSRSRWMQMSILATWWTSAVIHYIIQNKFYEYHALPIFAPLALMTSNLFVDVKKTRGLIRFAFGVLGTLLMVANFYFYDFPQKYIRLCDVISGNITVQTVYNDKIFDDGKDFSSRADIKVAKYLIVNTNQNENIFIWGFEPGIYFLTQRRNATRFIYNFPLYGPNANSEWRQEFLKEIQAQKPTYIAIVKNDNMFHVTATNGDSWTEFNYFTEFRDFVLENYRLETTIEDFVIYRLEP